MKPGAYVPTVKRRDVLRAAAALAAAGTAGAAGCVGGQQAPPGDGSNGTPTGSPTPPDTPSDPPTSFAVTSARCGDQVSRAAVSVEAGTVTVEGVTWGNDACYTARLDTATFHGNTLIVRVVAESAADDEESCAQCITEIEYRATVETPSTPDEVVVIHDGETVATARP